MGLITLCVFIIIRHQTKLVCCPPPPAPIFLKFWREKSFYCTKEYLPDFEIPEKVFVFFFKFEIYFEHAKQFSTLLNWFKELMKWSISKIAP